MLECRTYTYAELSELFGTRDSQGIKRRLDRLEIAYTTQGRRAGLQFTLTEICNPFKVYCTLDLDFSPQTDFKKLAFFTYYLLCDDDFQQLPPARMEYYLQAEGHTLTRQTINTYMRRLENADLIYRGMGYTYYFAYKSTHIDTDEKTYKRAWAEYWDCIHNGYGWERSIGQMRAKYGGIARKHPVLVLNAFYISVYEKLTEWAGKIVEADVGKSD